jgi:hypothetical protein
MDTMIQQMRHAKTMITSGRAPQALLPAGFGRGGGLLAAQAGHELFKNLALDDVQPLLFRGAAVVLKPDSV